MKFDLLNNYAGNVNVERSGHPNNTLFFWAFEHEEGSLTAAAGQNDTVPWAIWLQGGYVVMPIPAGLMAHTFISPGSSSLSGLTTENGPIQVVSGKEKLVRNVHAWSNLIDYIWVDQPVCVILRLSSMI